MGQESSRPLPQRSSASFVLPHHHDSEQHGTGEPHRPLPQGSCCLKIGAESLPRHAQSRYLKAPDALLHSNAYNVLHGPRTKTANIPTGISGSPKRKRQANVYDAVAERVAADRFLPATPYISKNRDTASSSTLPIPPEEVLFRHKAAPDRDDEDDFYWANRHLGPGQCLPDSDLLKAIHAYASDFYTRATRNAGVGDFRSMNETALLAIAILLEESAKQSLGEAGDMVFVEARESFESELDTSTSENSQEQNCEEMDVSEDEKVSQIQTKEGHTPVTKYSRMRDRELYKVSIDGESSTERSEFEGEAFGSASDGSEERGSGINERRNPETLEPQDDDADLEPSLEKEASFPSKMEQSKVGGDENTSRDLEDVNQVAHRVIQRLELNENRSSATISDNPGMFQAALAVRKRKRNDEENRSQWLDDEIDSVGSLPCNTKRDTPSDIESDAPDDELDSQEAYDGARNRKKSRIEEDEGSIEL